MNDTADRVRGDLDRAEGQRDSSGRESIEPSLLLGNHRIGKPGQVDLIGHRFDPVGVTCVFGESARYLAGSFEWDTDLGWLREGVDVAPSVGGPGRRHLRTPVTFFMTPGQGVADLPGSV
jgi:hypothetical protein